MPESLVHIQGNQFRRDVIANDMFPWICAEHIMVLTPTLRESELLCNQTLQRTCSNKWCTSTKHTALQAFWVTLVTSTCKVTISDTSFNQANHRMENTLWNNTSWFWYVTNTLWDDTSQLHHVMHTHTHTHTVTRHIWGPRWHYISKWHFSDPTCHKGVVWGHFLIPKYYKHIAPLHFPTLFPNHISNWHVKLSMCPSTLSTDTSEFKYGNSIILS